MASLIKLYPMNFSLYAQSINKKKTFSLLTCVLNIFYICIFPALKGLCVEWLVVLNISINHSAKLGHVQIVCYFAYAYYGSVINTSWLLNIPLQQTDT